MRPMTITPGTRVGKLVTLTARYNRTGWTWACWCDCGKYVQVTESRLRGNIRTCTDRSRHPTKKQLRKGNEQ